MTVKTAPAIYGQESTEGKHMSRYLSQRCWGRSYLHLAAAMRGGHWHWHLAGIRREIHFKKPLTLSGPTTAGG